MKTYHTFYVVDPVAEQVVGSFAAISKEMAEQIIKKSFFENEKYKGFADQFRFYGDLGSYDIFETYSEIVASCAEASFVRSVKND